jgi:hypothetical protein
MSALTATRTTTTTARKGITVKVVSPTVIKQAQAYADVPTWMLEELRDGLAQMRESWALTKVDFSGVAKSQLKKAQITAMEGGKAKDRYDRLVRLGNKHEVVFTRLLNKFLAVQASLEAADYALAQRKNRDASRLGNGTANLA